MCKYTQIDQWLKQCCYVIWKSTQGLKTPGCIWDDNNSPKVTCWWICSFGDIFFLTLMLLFFSLLSTHLRPPSSPGGSRPTEGPVLSLKWTMLLLAKEKPLIVSQVSYLCQDMQLMLGGLSTQTYSIVLSPEEARSSTDSRLTHRRTNTHCAHINTRRHTKGLVVLLHPATRGCRQCAPIIPGFSPRFLSDQRMSLRMSDR